MPQFKISRKMRNIAKTCMCGLSVTVALCASVHGESGDINITLDQCPTEPDRGGARTFSGLYKDIVGDVSAANREDIGQHVYTVQYAAGVESISGPNEEGCCVNGTTPGKRAKLGWTGYLMLDFSEGPRIDVCSWAESGQACQAAHDAWTAFVDVVEEHELGHHAQLREAWTEEFVRGAISEYVGNMQKDFYTDCAEQIDSGEVLDLIEEIQSTIDPQLAQCAEVAAFQIDAQGTEAGLPSAELRLEDGCAHFTWQECH